LIVSNMEKIKIEDLSLWESFYWVSRTGSFTGAAKQLAMSVAFLSKKIGRLEETLGTRLFNRTTRRVSMTDEAKQLFPRVEALLEEAAQIEGVKASTQEAGLIRLTHLRSRVCATLSAGSVGRVPKAAPERAFRSARFRRLGRSD
jgi:DNA-binding transcriptional LysR family regulator